MYIFVPYKKTNKQKYYEKTNITKRRNRSLIYTLKKNIATQTGGFFVENIDSFL
jgi:hypothetical protein